ncbi:MAG: hypothetical protein AAF489_09195 [Bacteroidota bacterium]
MEKKGEKDDFFVVTFDKDLFQPVLTDKLFGTTYFISGKFFSKDKKKKYLNEIHLKYKRTFGLINFKIEDIEVSREYDDEVEKEIIQIKVYFRAFAKTDDKEYFIKKLNSPVKIMKDEFIHVKPMNLPEEIEDFDEEDDITYNYQEPATNDVPCRSSTNGGD